jgi:hypothetical protein
LASNIQESLSPLADELLARLSRAGIPPLLFVRVRSSRDWTEFFSNVLEKAQDELAAKSSQRDPADWIVLDRGKSGISAIYDTWRWLRSRIRGGGFARRHNTEERI